MFLNKPQIAPANLTPGSKVCYKGDTLTVIAVSNRVFITGQPGRLFDVLAVDQHGRTRKLCLREFNRLELA